MAIYRTLLFPVGAILISIYAYLQPTTLSALSDAIVPLLGVVMFSMGMSLRPVDFKNVLVRPRLIVIGIGLQYLLMPLIAFCLAQLLGLPAILAAGLVLVGACPGGTASNVICYLARGNVALSITLTGVSTLTAVILTPLLTQVYVSTSIDVPVMSMMKSLLMIVVFPVLAGVLINHRLHTRLGGVQRLLPLVSMASVILIIGIIVAINGSALVQIGPVLLFAVVMHNLLGLGSGYFFARLLQCNHEIAKTMAIEVGMQNSGLGIVLANQYFSAMAALPGVLFSIWHNVSGAILAAIWNRTHKQYE